MLDESYVGFSIEKLDILELVEKRTEFVRYPVRNLYVWVDYWHGLELVRASHSSYLSGSWVSASLRYVFRHAFGYRSFLHCLIVHSQVHESVVYRDYDDKILFVARDIEVSGKRRYRFRERGVRDDVGTGFRSLERVSPYSYVSFRIALALALVVVLEIQDFHRDSC